MHSGISLSQLFLGFTYNWGAMMGWAATGLPMRWHVILPLYAAGIFWTLLYDTIYANQVHELDQASCVCWCSSVVWG